ncbi:DUF4097 family beta strand repeat-containing protein [Streptomyces sp. TR06-5]|uniref:DUF4097 family beta strand repeat-containing protein n=1 Tax=unclassified Streptomyces TaxID=2593676 RepID=UPI0039A29B4C
MPEVSAPQTLAFDHPLDELDVRLIGGSVNIVGTEESGARVEITDIRGRPLTVRREGARLDVGHDELFRKDVLRILERRKQHCEADVTVSVPAGTRVRVGVVRADTVVSGVDRRTEVRGVSAGITLVGLGGEVRVDTVSGHVEAQALRDSLRVNAVSGSLTVVDGAASTLRADTVSGDVIIDLDRRAAAADVRLNTVSGEIAVRLAEPADTTVEAATAGGTVSSAFDEVRADGPWGARRLNGSLGNGTGRLRAHTVSGPIALLRRPPTDEAPPVGSGLRKEV